MNPILKKSWLFLLDLLFPIRCLACGRFDEWLCSDCQAVLQKPPEPQCPHCRRLQSSNQTCPNCLGVSALSGLFVLADYQKQLVERLIHSLKYQYLAEIGALLGQLLAQSFQKSEAVKPADQSRPIVTVVPLHWRRQNERGFNQSELIARVFAETLDWPLRTDILVRTVHTSAQAKLSRAVRLENLCHVFRIRNGVVLSGQTVIIIDDVATTTATLETCAQALKKSGARAIWGAVIARSQEQLTPNNQLLTFNR